MPVPTFVFHGSDDPIVPVRASERFRGLGNVTVTINDGLLSRAAPRARAPEVLAEVVAWIRAEGRAGVAAPAPMLPTALG